jgi:hypothetical protein
MTPDAATLAGLLLVASPVLGLIPVGYPPLVPVWTAPRPRHLEIVASHKRAWQALNAGFVVATLGTAGGLAALAVALGDSAGWSAAVAALGLAYLGAGSLWCAVLAIRARTTPALWDLGAAAGDPGEAERLLATATSGLFAAFILVTGPVIVALSAVLAMSGAVAVPVAVIAALMATISTASQVKTGDSIPAVLYMPTLLIGIALLAGWR